MSNKDWQWEHGESINRCIQCKEHDEFKDIVKCDRDEGVPPRCFYLDQFRTNKEKKDGKVKGIVVVGLNPGRAGKKEREANVTNEKAIEYSEERNNWINKWDGKEHMIKFYKRINYLLNDLNENVDVFDFDEVLWTEIFKCELKQELPQRFSTKFRFFEHYWRMKIISICFNIEFPEKVNEFVKYYKYHGINQIKAKDISVSEHNVIQDMFNDWQRDNPGKTLHHYIKDVFLRNKKLSNISTKELNNGLVSFDPNPSIFDELVIDCLKEDDDILGLEKLFNRGHNVLDFKAYFEQFGFCFKLKGEDIWLEGHKGLQNDLDESQVLEAINSCPIFINSQGSNVAFLNVRNYEDVAAYCFERFLAQELKNIPEEWPIMCIGKESFNYMRYACPNRLVIGLPHATGAYGGQINIYLDKGDRKDLYKYLNSFYDEGSSEVKIRSKYFTI